MDDEDVDDDDDTSCIDQTCMHMHSHAHTHTNTGAGRSARVPSADSVRHQKNLRNNRLQWKIFTKSLVCVCVCAGVCMCALACGLSMTRRALSPVQGVSTTHSHPENIRTYVSYSPCVLPWNHRLWWESECYPDQRRTHGCHRTGLCA